MKIVLMTSDLMTASQVQMPATNAGASLSFADTTAALLEQCGDGAIDLVIFDLATLDKPIGEVTDQLRSLPAPPGKMIAFGPHVHEAKLQAARDAGCDEVLARGQFFGAMGSYLAG